MNSSKEENSWIDLQKGDSQNNSEEAKSIKSEEKLKRNLAHERIESPISNKSEMFSQSNASSYFAPNRTPNVSCKIHKKEFLIVDSLKFKVHCAKCMELGEKNKFLEITKEIDSDDSASDDDFECSTHPNSKGVFYCDDCQVFLCKLCFANEHRSHKSNLPEDIAQSYMKSLKGITENISNIKPKLEENLKCISEIDKKIKSIREGSINKMKGLTFKINNIIKSKYEHYTSQFEATFEGMDLEVENIAKRLESHQKRSIKYISEINDILNYLQSNSIKTSIDFCSFKKSKHPLILEIMKMLEDSKNFISFKIENTKMKANGKIEEFNKQTQKFFKQLNIYEKSVMNSIYTGISSSSLRLRRFSKFYYKLYEYYKTSSLICKVSSPICLVGFGLCGLYRGSTKNSNLPIQIQVFELKSEEFKKNEPLITESHHLNIIANHDDPTLVIYLNKAINLKPETKYMFTIANQHKDTFLEIWCGEVAKVFLKNMNQFVHCNTSHINFEFFTSEGVESDFNEFNVGLFSDLFFSTTGQ